VFNVEADGKSDYDAALEGIGELRAFWNRIGAPEKLSYYGIEENSIEEMAEKTVIARPEYGNFKKLTKQDSVEILRASL
jgi:hypothetical protein